MNAAKVTNPTLLDNNATKLQYYKIMIPQKRLKKNSFCQENEALNENRRLALQDLSNYLGFAKYVYAFNGHFHYAFLKVFFATSAF